MPSREDRAADISVRQFVADSGSVTRGLRQGRSYTLTLNGQPLARIVPVRQRLAVPRDEVLAEFAAAPAVDVTELRADLDEAVSQDDRDPYAGTGL
jgi:antitoxin (DNA-binding transcriptional repressor) of toxin-antitoxin stability system